MIRNSAPVCRAIADLRISVIYMDDDIFYPIRL